MALDFDTSLELGKAAQARAGKYSTSFGWYVDGIGSIGKERVPVTYIPETESGENELTAPDQTIKRRGWPFSITLEVKNKESIKDKFWVDVRRLNYITKWARETEQFVLWVIEDERKNRELICASNDKLSSTPHREYNPYSKDRYGNPEPTWMFQSQVFVPFKDFLISQIESFHTTRSLHLPNSTGEEILI